MAEYHKSQLRSAMPGRRLLLAGAAAGSIGAVLPNLTRGQTAMAPDAALDRLMEGNRRFVAGRLDSFEEDLRGGTVLRRLQGASRAGV